MRRLLYWGLLLALAVVSAGCNAFIPADTSLISGTPCAPPCWQNLTPGVSTMADVERFVGGLRASEQERLETGTDPAGYKLFTWFGAKNGKTRLISVDEDRVKLILIAPDFDLNLGTVVDHFGPPESLFAIHGGYGHGGTYRLELYYPQQGLAFESRPGIEYLGEVRPDMSVYTIYYFASGDLANYFDGQGWTDDYVDAIMRYVQPWPGFGQIEVPMERP